MGGKLRVFKQRRMTKGLRAFGLVFDVFAIGMFLILFFVSSGWEAALSMLFALWCAYDWWVGYNTKIVEEE